ncbi:MAG TPA: GNAT family N-acetyltransferase [Syntrophomonadaceae bacterium]|nr:GNAT family N-acetyltransferase [Syntrophomonadaceae bacterium]HQA07350.1 GNAT family N-acetyltransferase [Syntrophomonadaceae bacterium]HQE23311.1 GNAT family N-acetyltransferase [Syntrophomonadaceae bacterium]
MSQILIRPAKLEDCPSIARVRISTWRSAYQGIVPQRHLDELSLPVITRQFQDIFQQENPCLWVAEQKDEITGFAHAGEYRGDDPAAGEVYAIYILDKCQGQGIGSQLMASVCQQLHQTGKEFLYVAVLEDNPYRLFYERLGGQIIRKETFAMEDKPLPLVYYWWSDINQLCQDSKHR